MYNMYCVRKQCTVNVQYNYITNILSVSPWYKRIVRKKERGRERERDLDW